MDVGRTLFYTNTKDGSLFLKKKKTNNNNNKKTTTKNKTGTSRQVTTMNKKVTLGKILDFRHFSTLF